MVWYYGWLAQLTCIQCFLVTHTLAGLGMLSTRSGSAAHLTVGMPLCSAALCKSSCSMNIMECKREQAEWAGCFDTRFVYKHSKQQHIYIWGGGYWGWGNLPGNMVGN